MGRIIADWLKQIGINIRIDVVDSGTLTDRLYDNGDFDMYIWTYFMDVDPTSILKIMTTGQIMSWNDSFYSNPSTTNFSWSKTGKWIRINGRPLSMKCRK